MGVAEWKHVKQARDEEIAHQADKLLDVLEGTGRYEPVASAEVAVVLLGAILAYRPEALADDQRRRAEAQIAAHALKGV